MIKYTELYGEKEVEHFWWSVLKTFFPNSSVEARNVGKKTDGILIDEENKIRTLIEVKEDLDFSKGSEQAKVLIQSIFYIKQHEKAGEKLPKTIFIADKNEVFIVHTNAIQKYLDYDIDWNVAPSNAYKIYTDFVINITNDKEINPFVFKLKDGFNFDTIRNNLIDLNQNVKRLIKINDENIQQVFEYFLKHVLIKNKNTINEQVNLFIDLLINPNENYLHPKKKNMIVSKFLGFIKVNEKNYINFFEHFDGNQYTIKEKEKLVSIIDRLIEYESRKRNGEFFTPKIWVDEAHKMISEEFGDDWKEKYVVWDCAWGTGNLTRDYKFKELYCSTLHQSDINTANQIGINQEATKFAFDFLNDDLELLKEPDYAPGLYDAIQEGKEILFLINPPYKRVSNKSLENTHTSTKIETCVGKDMKDLGNSVEQLYSQFMFKISKTNNTKIAIFSPSLYKSGSSFKKFRNYFFKKNILKKSMLFEASNFSDVANGWGIDFSIWENGIETNTLLKTTIKEINIDMEIYSKSEKNIYNLDNKIKFSDYIREKTKKMKSIDAPQLSASLNIKDGKSVRSGKMIKNAFGYYFCAANNIEKNSSNATLFTSAYSNGIGLSIIPINYMDVISNFTSRKLFIGKYATWVNGKDEYIAPSEEVQNTLEYKQYNNDAIVHSLFQSNSNQSSMRQVEYKDKLWDIKNEFFWLSKEEMMNLSDKHYIDEIYKDAINNDDRFVYKLLNGKLSEEEFNEVGLTHIDENNKPILSSDTQELLDLSKELIIKSFKYRKLIIDEYPEYHLDTFDAGWYQYKKIFNKYMKDEYKVFTDKYKEFEGRLRPKVYDFGMLLK